jgi:WYL domain
MNTEPTRPLAWVVLEQALTERRPVRIRYHGTDRVVCPHALGWKNGRPKVLAYQPGGTTSRGPLPPDPHQRWRSMFIDEIEQATIAEDPWATAANYSSTSNGIDQLAIAISD